MANRDLSGIGRPKLRAWLAQSGHERWEHELWTWLYRRGGRDFAGLAAFQLPGDLIERLRSEATVGRLPVELRHRSADGTEKWLVVLEGGHRIESVFIPGRERGTLCVSSQVGCTLTCRFCHTGTQPLARNLTAAEIVGQVLVARDLLGEWGLPSAAPRRLTNIVFMGMGEPFYNYEGVAAAIQILSDDAGLALSKRRITISTSGIVPAMRQARAELGVNLTVSLHAARDAVRNEIMPINRKYPLAELMQACREYQGASHSRRILFAYTMLDGINDSDADARDLLQLLADFPAKVNLIPFNPWPGAPYSPTPLDRIRAFQRILNDAGMLAQIRYTRGDDILAACGQLKTATPRRSEETASN